MAYDYKEAGKNAPTGVRQAIQQFHRLSKKEKESKPLLYFLLGSGTPPYKMSKKDGEYTDISLVSGQTCANCRFAYHQPIRKFYICSQIRGKIKPNGWCRLWKP